MADFCHGLYNSYLAGIIAGIISAFREIIMARDFAKAFYNSKEWAAVREAVLMRDRYLCVHCGKPAEEVHHKKHLTPGNIGDVNITLSMDNLESLCKACHFEEHRGEHGKGRETKENFSEYVFDENGMLVKRNNFAACPRYSSG